MNTKWRLFICPLLDLSPPLFVLFLFCISYHLFCFLCCFFDYSCCFFFSYSSFFFFGFFSCFLGCFFGFSLYFVFGFSSCLFDVVERFFAFFALDCVINTKWRLFICPLLDLSPPLFVLFLNVA